VPQKNTSLIQDGVSRGATRFYLSVSGKTFFICNGNTRINLFMLIHVFADQL